MEALIPPLWPTGAGSVHSGSPEARREPLAAMAGFHGLAALWYSAIHAGISASAIGRGRRVWGELVVIGRFGGRGPRWLGHELRRELGWQLRCEFGCQLRRELGWQLRCELGCQLRREQRSVERRPGR